MWDCVLWSTYGGGVYFIVIIYVFTIIEGKIMNIWTCPYDDTMPSLFLLSYASGDLDCMVVYACVYLCNGKV